MLFNNSSNLKSSSINYIRKIFHLIQQCPSIYIIIEDANFFIRVCTAQIQIKRTLKSSLLCQHPKIVINIGVVSRSLFLSMTRVLTQINTKFIVVCRSKLQFAIFLRRLLFNVCLFAQVQSFCLKISLFNTPFNINVLILTAQIMGLNNK